MDEAISDFVRATIEREAALVGDGGDVERPKLRADLATGLVEATVGEKATVHLQVTNTSEVIEVVSVQLLGLMAETVDIHPAELALFPGESADVELELGFHSSLPSGEHEGLVVVSGVSERVAPAIVPLRVRVPTSAALAMEAEPPLRTAGRKASFEVFVHNRGNTPLDVRVSAVDANRDLSFAIERTLLDLGVDGSDAVEVVARGKRPWTGAPIEHEIEVTCTAGELEEKVDLRFRQKPRLSAGVITILTLMVIVALWALAMYFGVARALAAPPQTKVFPESFTGGGVGLENLDPAGAGGTATGTVTASSTALPVARVTVEAFDRRGRLVAATATGEDGTYELTGLLPVRHTLRIRAPGFQDQWWPGVPTADQAETVFVSPSAPAEGLDVRLVGDPGALGGQVIAGDGDPAVVRVTIEGLDVVGAGATAATTADAEGNWSVGRLVAPATYRITYEAEGYAPVEVVQPLDAGQQFVVNTTRLPAAAGSIRGIVVDGRTGARVGGVEIVAQQGATEASFTTPTAGEVGVFLFEDLETPGTYLLTFSAEGFASQTRAVRLGPGEGVTDLEVALSPASGVVAGTVTSAATGGPLGDVVVTVSGGGVVLQASTLTSGEVGTFRLPGLPLPGTYTITFDAEGHLRETVRVELSQADPRATTDVELRSAVGTVTGRVVDDATGEGIGAVEVEVSDGETSRTSTTASVPASERGSFRLSGLVPGSYTVTARLEDGRSRTVLVEVEAGGVTRVEIRIPASS